MAGRVRHLQLWKGNYRVRIGVPAECRPHLPAPHTGKAELVKGLGTANLTLATKLAAPIVAIFQMMIEQARQQAAPMVWLHYDRPPQPPGNRSPLKLAVVWFPSMSRRCSPIIPLLNPNSPRSSITNQSFPRLTRHP